MPDTRAAVVVFNVAKQNSREAMEAPLGRVPKNRKEIRKKDTLVRWRMDFRYRSADPRPLSINSLKKKKEKKR